MHSVANIFYMQQQVSVTVQSHDSVAWTNHNAVPSSSIVVRFFCWAWLFQRMAGVEQLVKGEWVTEKWHLNAIRSTRNGIECTGISCRWQQVSATSPDPWARLWVRTNQKTATSYCDERLVHLFLHLLDLCVGHPSCCMAERNIFVVEPRFLVYV
jgi:hypothetical protein